MLVSGKQEARRTATGVRHGLGDFGIDNVHDRGDQRTGRKILPGAALFVLSVLFEDLFINGAFEVALHHIPVILGYHVDNLFEHNGLVDLVGRFGENGADQPVRLGEFFEDILVFVHKIGAAEGGKVFPLIALRQVAFQPHNLFLVVHFEEKDISKLGDIIGKSHACRREDVCDIPNF